MPSSGFKDIIYQARIVTSGSLEGVLNGSHYSWACEAHEVVSEAMERLLFKRFRCGIRLGR